ncbi:MAG: hypothetical protein ACOVVK_13645 [Elsteraceae bacterium]
MISNDTLEAAVARNLLTAAQADSLRALERAREAIDPPPIDEERLRFVSGFSDIFVAIGLLLFLGAFGYFLSDVGGAATAGGVAVGSWLLAEFFTRRRRMALPSILLLVGFVGGVFMAVVGALSMVSAFKELSDASILAGPAAAISAWAHYRRFRVPITPAAGAGALVAMIVGVIFAVTPDHAPGIIPMLLAICGVILFTIALRLDREDPERLTRKTDIAFWLHLLAGPLIVHPVMFYSGALADDPNPTVTIILFVFLAILALAADRRAILVSSLIYTGVAIGYLARAGGLAESATVAFSTLVLGAVILTLSAGWRPIRRAVMGVMPSRLSAWFPNQG